MVQPSSVRRAAGGAGWEIHAKGPAGEHFPPNTEVLTPDNLSKQPQGSAPPTTTIKGRGQSFPEYFSSGCTTKQCLSRRLQRTKQ